MQTRRKTCEARRCTLDYSNPASGTYSKFRDIDEVPDKPYRLCRMRSHTKSESWPPDYDRHRLPQNRDWQSQSLDPANDKQGRKQESGRSISWYVRHSWNQRRSSADSQPACLPNWSASANKQPRYAALPPQVTQIEPPRASHGFAAETCRTHSALRLPQTIQMPGDSQSYDPAQRKI